MNKIRQQFWKGLVVFAVMLTFLSVSWPAATSAKKHKVQKQHHVAKSAKLSQFRVVHGRKVCRKSHSHPSYSKKGKGNHVDEDCCPDPDEWPNKKCSYSSADYSIML
ncbi:MAG TPA: hypothetical protein VK254_02155 [Candidatus Bathyarchaeia archaeon]|nr:hypothetical protein [Candidatus Bathyarchaeia archaeon]